MTDVVKSRPFGKGWEWLKTYRGGAENIWGAEDLGEGRYLTFLYER